MNILKISTLRIKVCAYLPAVSNFQISLPPELPLRRPLVCFIPRRRQAGDCDFDGIGGGGHDILGSSVVTYDALQSQYGHLKNSPFVPAQTENRCTDTINLIFLLHLSHLIVSVLVCTFIPASPRVACQRNSRAPSCCTRRRSTSRQ